MNIMLSPSQCLWISAILFTLVFGLFIWALFYSGSMIRKKINGKTYKQIK